MENVIAIQAATIAKLQEENKRLLEKNAELDKRAQGIYGDYQTLQYELYGMPTRQEVDKLRLELCKAQMELKAYKDFEQVA